MLTDGSRKKSKKKSEKNKKLWKNQNKQNKHGDKRLPCEEVWC